MARTPTEMRLPDGTVVLVRVVHPRDMPDERPINDPTGLVWSTLMAGGGSDE